MSIGMILLIVVAVLTLFGLTQRVFDRMKLNDKMALVFVAAMFVGGIIPDIQITDNISFNIGGALIPLALCVYLFVKSERAVEKWRSIIASIVTGGAVYGLLRVLPAEPESIVFDPNYVCGVAAAIIAYVLGRSRRCAFIAAVVGSLLSSIINAIVQAAQGLPYTLALGGGGFFDTVVLSGILAVVICEVVGEIWERAVKSREKHGEGDRR